MRRINHFSTDRDSDLFQVQINGVKLPVTVCPDVSDTDCEALADFYLGLHHPNIRQSPLAMAYHVVHCVWDTPVQGEVCIQTAKPVINFDIYPKRKAVQSRVDDCRLYLSIRPDTPYLVVEIDHLPVLCLVNESGVETPLPTDTVNFADYAAKYGQDGDHTAAFEFAVRDINGSGKTLWIPPGVYQTRSLKLHHCRDCRIHFAEGALVNMAVSPENQNVRIHGLWLHDCDRVQITGRGCLDQRSYENFNCGRNDYTYAYRGDCRGQLLYPLPPDDPQMMSPLLITNSRNISVRDITLRNGKVWNINVKNSHCLQFERCKVITPPGSNPEWTDGFNFGGCRDVQIKDCFVAVNDDCFAAGHYLGAYDTEGGDLFEVSGLVGYNPRAQGVRLGWACNRSQGRFRFEDCDFIGKCEVIIHPLQDDYNRRLDYGEVRFLNCGFDKFPDIGIEGASIRLLEFTDVTFSSPFTRGKGRIVGHPEQPIGRLIWQNVKFADGSDCFSDHLFVRHINPYKRKLQ